MRDLAQYVMRGPRQAALVAFVSTLIPMLFWLGAAVVALVTLRQGLNQGLSILVWAIIPALGWWLGLQDPGAFIVLVTTLVMANVLRKTVSWQQTLVSGCVVSLLVGLAAPLMMPELIETLMTMADEVFRQLAENAEIEYDSEIQQGFQSLMVASFAATFYSLSVVALFLARSWQSKLYNPGGWQQEFQGMRLGPLTIGFFVLLMVLAPSLELNSSLVMLVTSIPLAVCGFALVHGVIGKKKLGGHWLVGFYVSIVLLFPTMLVLVVFLAIFDSFINFRRFLQSA